jgi:mycothiol S-conjugate amidase
MRPLELQRAAEIIGFARVAMLGYRDSGMPGSEHNAHPACFHQAPLDEAAERLVRLIREERPHVLLTYNEDQQGYPHPDHLKVHAVSVLAFERAGDPRWYPQAGEPWQPLKLYYSLWSAPSMRAIHQALLSLRGTSPYSDAWLARAHREEQITTRVRVGDYLWARTQALRAHATQIDPRSPFWFGLSDDELRATYPFEDWCLARCCIPSYPPSATASSPGRERPLEDDLFAGLRLA